MEVKGLVQSIFALSPCVCVCVCVFVCVFITGKDR